MELVHGSRTNQKINMSASGDARRRAEERTKNVTRIKTFLLLAEIHLDKKEQVPKQKKQKTSEEVYKQKSQEEFDSVWNESQKVA